MSRIRQDTMCRLLFLLLLAGFALLANSFTLLPPSTRQIAFRPGSTAFQPVTTSTLLQSSSTNTASGEAESIFQKNCDKDGFMTKASLKDLEFVSELLNDGDLEEDELDQIWKTAAKLPGSSEERIDVDSFLQVYRDIDDLFEEDDEDDAEAEALAAAEIEAAEAMAAAEIEAASATEEDDNNNTSEDAELEPIFQSIANNQGLVSKKALRRWEEVGSLFDENLLDKEEFNAIFQKMPKTNGQLDLAGFVKFNDALDDLFDFDEEAEEEEEAVAAAEEGEAAASNVVEESKGMVEDEDLSPAELYKALADSDGLVGRKELKRWGELQDMISEGELMPLELENFFDAVVKSDKQPDKLNQEGFLALYDKIESLFEDDEDEEEEEDSTPKPASSAANKEQLLRTLASLNQDEERLPCGLESTENEQSYVKELVEALEAAPTNEVRLKQGAIEMADVSGSWELLYSSSSAMAYNKGLSGLGGSFPNGAFGGLKMKLSASKFMTDVEYIERINVTPDTASFDVTVTGNWELRSSVSIFTGEPSIALTVVPDMVTYGPTSTRADHWKSLGPTNMLDVSYLDEDLRIMRGNTNTDSILVFKRAK